MSFDNYKDTIAEGDLVFAWISRAHVKPIRIAAGGILNTRYGAFPHAAMVGQKYGSQVASKTGSGFVYLLHPTPELWTVSLPHRTQIVYSPDSSFITQKLHIAPGSTVIEAGTGSGSFTHSLSRTVADTGRLFTYEFHPLRYEQALTEFEDHQLRNLTITHRDVCKNGFEIEGTQINATAVFLDLPAPWAAIPNLDRAISSQEKAALCCFSPCIEQVEKTIHALHKHNWTSIETIEINFRKWESHKNMVRRTEDVVARLRDIQKRKKEGLAELRRLKEQREKAGAEAKKRPAGEALGEEEGEKHEPKPGISREDSEAPKTKTEDNGTEIESGGSQVPKVAEKPQPQPQPQQSKKTGLNPFGKGHRINAGDPNYEWREVSKDEAEMKSHTSFLTFAIRQPAF